MNDALSEQHRGAKQTFSGGGVTTERWLLPSGELEPMADFLDRHVEAEREFAEREDG